MFVALARAIMAQYSFPFHFRVSAVKYRPVVNENHAVGWNNPGA